MYGSEKNVKWCMCRSRGTFIGFFADDLNTVIGCVFFGLGVIMVASSLITAFKIDKQNKAKK